MLHVLRAINTYKDYFWQDGLTEIADAVCGNVTVEIMDTSGNTVKRHVVTVKCILGSCIYQKIQGTSGIFCSKPREITV